MTRRHFAHRATRLLIGAFDVTTAEFAVRSSAAIALKTRKYLLMARKSKKLFAKRTSCYTRN